MKKKVFSVLLVIALLLCACQETPETAAVISKNDGAFEEIALAEATAEAEDVQITRDSSFTSTDGSVSFQWEVDGTYSVANMPIAKVVPHFLTGSEIKAIAAAMMGDATFLEVQKEAAYTKAELQEKIQALTSYANVDAYAELYGRDPSECADGVSSLQAYILRLESSLEEAPENIMYSECEWTFKGLSAYTEYSDIGTSYIRASTTVDGYPYYLEAESRTEDKYFLTNNLNITLFDARRADDIVGIEDYIMNAKLLRTEEPTQADIDAVTEKVQAILDNFPVGQWSITSAYVSETQVGSASEYEIVVEAAPTFAGTPSLRNQPSEDITASDTYTGTYFTAGIGFTYNKDGVLLSFGVGNTIDTTQIVNENAQVISGDELVSIAESQLSLTDAVSTIGDEESYNHYAENYNLQEELCLKMHLTKIEFGLGRIDAADEDYTYYYVPVYAIYGSGGYYGQDSDTFYFSLDGTDEEREQSILWVNAVDGSIIYRGL